MVVVVGSLIVSRSDPVRVLRRSNHTQTTRKGIIKIIVGAGIVLFGVLLLFESLTFQLPGAV